MSLLAKTIVDGVLLAGIYVLIGMGLSLAFGVLDIVDFAVGGYVMVGAYAGSVLAPLLGDGLYAIPVILVGGFVLGYLLQPVISQVNTGDRALPTLMALAFTFGLAVLFRGAVRTIFGVNAVQVHSSLLGGSIEMPIVGVLSLVRLATALFGVVILLALFYFLYQTKSGTAIRAIAEDETNARLMGVNIPRYKSITYGLYTAMTTSAGVFIGMIYLATPSMTIQYATFAFFIVVLAGMGYLPGIILSALVLGVGQTVIAVFVSSKLVLLLLFALVYVIMLVRPTGILGKGEYAG